MESFFLENLGATAIVVLLWLSREIAGFALKLKLEKHKERLANALNRRLALVGWDLLGLIYTIWFAFHLFNNSAAASRRDVLIACGLTLFVVMATANLMDDLLQWAKTLRSSDSQTTGRVQAP